MLPEIYSVPMSNSTFTKGAPLGLCQSAIEMLLPLRPDYNGLFFSPTSDSHWPHLTGNQQTDLPTGNQLVNQLDLGNGVIAFHPCNYRLQKGEGGIVPTEEKKNLAQEHHLGRC